MGIKPDVVAVRELGINHIEIEQALVNGNRLRAFSSGAGLRVVIISNPSGEKIAYGEAPQIEEALEHAMLDFSMGHISYKEQYSGENALHTHYITGTAEISSPLDGHIRFGRGFEAYLTEDGMYEVQLSGMEFSPAVPDELINRVIATGVSETYSERGITYKLVLGRGALVFLDITDNPENKPATYSYTQTGTGNTFWEAVDDAFSAEKVEK